MCIDRYILIHLPHSRFYFNGLSFWMFLPENEINCKMKDFKVIEDIRSNKRIIYFLNEMLGQKNKKVLIAYGPIKIIFFFVNCCLTSLFIISYLELVFSNVPGCKNIHRINLWKRVGEPCLIRMRFVFINNFVEFRKKRKTEIHFLDDPGYFLV